MKRIFVTLAFLAPALVGCHAQLPTTPAYNTVWTWNAPTPTSNWSGCGTQGRTYVGLVQALGRQQLDAWCCGCGRG